jgi:hypothetical protein
MKSVYFSVVLVAEAAYPVNLFCALEHINCCFIFIIANTMLI